MSFPLPVHSSGLRDQGNHSSASASGKLPQNSVPSLRGCSLRANPQDAASPRQAQPTKETSVSSTLIQLNQISGSNSYQNSAGFPLGQPLLSAPTLAPHHSHTFVAAPVRAQNMPAQHCGSFPSTVSSSVHRPRSHVMAPIAIHDAAHPLLPTGPLSHDVTTLVGHSLPITSTCHYPPSCISRHPRFLDQQIVQLAPPPTDKVDPSARAPLSVIQAHALFPSLNPLVTNPPGPRSTDTSNSSGAPSHSAISSHPHSRLYHGTPVDRFPPSLSNLSSFSRPSLSTATNATIFPGGPMPGSLEERPVAAPTLRLEPPHQGHQPLLPKASLFPTHRAHPAPNSLTLSAPALLQFPGHHYGKGMIYKPNHLTPQPQVPHVLKPQMPPLSSVLPPPGLSQPNPSVVNGVAGSGVGVVARAGPIPSVAQPAPLAPVVPVAPGATSDFSPAVLLTSSICPFPQATSAAAPDTPHPATTHSASASASNHTHAPTPTPSTTADDLATPSLAQTRIDPELYAHIPDGFSIPTSPPPPRERRTAHLVFLFCVLVNRLRFWFQQLNPDTLLEMGVSPLCALYAQSYLQAKMLDVYLAICLNPPKASSFFDAPPSFALQIPYPSSFNNADGDLGGIGGEPQEEKMGRKRKAKSSLPPAISDEEAADRQAFLEHVTTIGVVSPLVAGGLTVPLDGLETTARFDLLRMENLIELSKRILVSGHNCRQTRARPRYNVSVGYLERVTWENPHGFTADGLNKVLQQAESKVGVNGWTARRQTTKLLIDRWKAKSNDSTESSELLLQAWFHNRLPDQGIKSMNQRRQWEAYKNRVRMVWRVPQGLGQDQWEEDAKEKADGDGKSDGAHNNTSPDPKTETGSSEGDKATSLEPIQPAPYPIDFDPSIDLFYPSTDPAPTYEGSIDNHVLVVQQFLHYPSHQGTGSGTATVVRGQMTTTYIHRDVYEAKCKRAFDAMCKACPFPPIFPFESQDVVGPDCELAPGYSPPFAAILSVIRAERAMWASDVDTPKPELKSSN